MSVKDGRIVSDGPQTFEGELIKMDDVLGKDIKVLDFAFAPSQFAAGEYVSIQIEIGAGKTKETRVLRSGATTIMSVLKNVDKAKLPLETKIEKGKSAKGRPIYNFV